VIQDDLFAPTAQQLADEGMQRAADHADRVEEGWSDRAYGLLEDFARAHCEFMTEDVRQWAHEKQALPKPPDPRAWGAVTARGINSKLIVRVGYRKTRIPPAHSTPRPVWRSTIYAEAA
jgi:hypothetical protein